LGSAFVNMRPYTASVMAGEPCPILRLTVKTSRSGRSIAKRGHACQGCGACHSADSTWQLALPRSPSRSPRPHDRLGATGRCARLGRRRYLHVDELKSGPPISRYRDHHAARVTMTAHAPHKNSGPSWGLLSCVHDERMRQCLSGSRKPLYPSLRATGAGGLACSAAVLSCRFWCGGIRALLQQLGYPLHSSGLLHFSIGHANLLSSIAGEISTYRTSVVLHCVL
jgi:hypothetical protein